MVYTCSKNNIVVLKAKEDSKIHHHKDTFPNKNMSICSGVNLCGIQLQRISIKHVKLPGRYYVIILRHYTVSSLPVRRRAFACFKSMISSAGVLSVQKHIGKPYAIFSSYQGVGLLSFCLVPQNSTP